MGDSVAVTVSSSSRTGTFVYLASSRARIIAYGSGTLDSPTFNLPITQEFTPEATLLVYAVVGGELLADSIQFNVEGTFLNEVRLFIGLLPSNAINHYRHGSFRIQMLGYDLSQYFTF